MLDQNLYGQLGFACSSVKASILSNCKYLHHKVSRQHRGWETGVNFSKVKLQKLRINDRNA